MVDTGFWVHLVCFLPWFMVFALIQSLSSLLLEKAMAPHSSPLAWRVPWTEEPGGLQSMGSQRVGQDWATSLSLFTFCIGEGNGSPLQRSCLENPRDGGAWWAPIYGVAQSRTRLKWLSSSSSSFSLIGLTRSALSQALCFCFSNNLTHLLGF